jgi:hypothetical protein
LFEGNVTHDSIELLLKDCGSSDAPIFVSSYGPGTAVLNPLPNAPTIHILDCGWIEILNLNVVGPGPQQSSTPGILVESRDATQALNGITITAVEVSGFLSGLTFISQGCFGFSYVLIVRVSAHHNRDNGISSYGPWTTPFTCFAHHNFILEDCAAFNNAGCAMLSSFFSLQFLCLSSVAVATGLRAGRGWYLLL